MTQSTSARKQITTIAAGMVAGELQLLDGCRQIVSLRPSLSEPDLYDSDLLCLVAVESELEHIPLGSVRELWDPDAVIEKDRELAEYLQLAKHEILDACRALIARWAASA
jgi:hypothetical protein